MRRFAISAAVGFALLMVCTGGGLPTQIGPEGQPSGSGSCPPEPLLPGSVGLNGSLVAFLQPGPEAGTTCALPNGGTLVGADLIVLLYTPTEISNGSIPLSVEEFVPETVQVTIQGPNNTTTQESEVVESQVAWSNTTIPSGPGDAQELVATVPQVTQREQLRVEILDVDLLVSIVVPGAGIAIPINYPQLLEHDAALDVFVVIAFAVGVGIATVIRLRARHIDRLWPFGVAGVFALFGTAGWFYANYPASLIPLGAAPEAVVVAPITFAGMYLWLALFPTEARQVRIEFPVADTQDGERLFDYKVWREFRGPDGTEYIGPGGNGILLRILGVRTMLNNRVLTDSPYRMRYASFRSVRSDTYCRYYAWAEFTGGTKIREVARSRVFIFPWRARTQEAIGQYHRRALRGEVEPPAHVGFFFYVTPSRAFVAATGPQVAVLVQAWIQGTLTNSRMGLALQKVLNAYLALRAEYRTRAIDYGQKMALVMQVAEEFPDSPVGEKMLEDLNTRLEADLLDQRAWFDWVREQTPEAPLASPPVPTAASVAAAVTEAITPEPPWSRRRGSRGTGASPP